MQKIKSLQELKQLATEIPICVTVQYGILGLTKWVQYFDYSDSWKVIELYDGSVSFYSTEELILDTNIFKGILAKSLVIYKVAQ